MNASRYMTPYQWICGCTLPRTGRFQVPRSRAIGLIWCRTVMRGEGFAEDLGIVPEPALDRLVERSLLRCFSRHLQRQRSKLRSTRMGWLETGRESTCEGLWLGKI